MDANKPVIVHVSADYPDSLVPAKTKAVKALVEGTPEFNHIVYSINRVNGLRGQAIQRFDKYNTAIAYRALPKGLLWEPRLKELSAWIVQDLRAQKIKPDLIEGHKFTIEGLIVQDMAKSFACPYVVDIQGGTDVKILKIKKSLRSRYKEIAHESSAVFPYAPWVMNTFVPLTGLDEKKCVFLPVVPGFNTFHQATQNITRALVSVFHLDSWPRKNFDGMLAAISFLRNRYPDITLDVYGQGNIKNFMALDSLIASQDLRNHVRLMGVAKNASLPEVLKNYAGFVLPSKTESFGLVYTEALFSGLPILWNKDQGISGFLHPSDVGYACNPHNPSDIAAGIVQLLENQKFLKDSINKMQFNGKLNFLKAESIHKSYSAGIERALKGVR